MPGSGDEGGELAERGHIEEAQVGHVYLHGPLAVELDVGEGSLELFEIAAVDLTADDGLGGILVVGDLDSEAYIARLEGSHEFPRLLEAATSGALRVVSSPGMASS